MANKTKNSKLSLEERLEQALIPNWDEPYKLPENWCWVKLSTVCSLENGEKSTEKDLVYLDAKTLRGIAEPQTRDSGIIVNKDQKVILVDGENSGEVFVVPYRGYMGSTFKIINISANADEMYIRYFIDQNREKLRNSKVGSAIPHLNKDLFFDLKLPFPPLSEQKRIVAHIETLFAKFDEAREKAQEVVDGFETRKAAILHKAFSGELTAKWREANGIKSNNWELIKLQDVCEKIVCGKTPTEYIAEHGEVPFLKVYNIVDNQIDFETTPQFIPKSIHHGKLKSSGLKPNDIIMNIVGPPLRKIAIIPDTYPEWNMNQAIVRFRPTEALNHKFLYYALINPETLDEVIAATRGVVGQANISVSQSRSLTINMPSWDEQIEVVRILDCIIEKEIYAKDSATAVIDQIDTMKKAILARAFRGELGTNDPSEESAVELLKRVLSGGEN